MSDWQIFRGTSDPHDGIDNLPAPPTWRRFDVKDWRGQTFQAGPEETLLVNAAFLLRRPLLVTGKPGIGKSSLADAVARELRLGRPLKWRITSRSTLKEGLYDYDAIGRLQAANLEQVAAAGRGATSKDSVVPAGEGTPADGVPDIGRYIRLGPLGTALLPSDRPRVLLIDEIDKSDIDLPNDLLTVFEEGEFEIPELARLPTTQQRIEVLTADKDEEAAEIHGGVVRCRAFPFVLLTSNGEREFPPPFLRRCLRLDIQEPDPDKLARIVEAHLGKEAYDRAQQVVERFLQQREQGVVATDQLLNAVYIVTQKVGPTGQEREKLLRILLRELSGIA